VRKVRGGIKKQPRYLLTYYHVKTNIYPRRSTPGQCLQLGFAPVVLVGTGVEGVELGEIDLD
jgi:hypothetical protein